MNRSKNIALSLSFALAVTGSFISADASARMLVGGGVVIGAPRYYYPPYYAYPYETYTPAPQYYSYVPPAQPPVIMQQPQPAPAQEYCREFNRSTMINGKMENVYGTACRQPDGTWKMVD